MKILVTIPGNIVSYISFSIRPSFSLSAIDLVSIGVYEKIETKERNK